MTRKESETDVYRYNAQSLRAFQNTEFVLGLIRLCQWRQELGPDRRTYGSVAVWSHQEGWSHHQHRCGSLRPRCCGLINGDVTESRYMASYEVWLVKKNVEIMSKGVVVAKHHTKSRHAFVSSEKTTINLGYSVCKWRFFAFPPGLFPMPQEWSSSVGQVWRSVRINYSSSATRRRGVALPSCGKTRWPVFL